MNDQEEIKIPPRLRKFPLGCPLCKKSRDWYQMSCKVKEDRVIARKLICTNGNCKFIRVVECNEPFVKGEDDGENPRRLKIYPQD